MIFRVGNTSTVKIRQRIGNKKEVISVTGDVKLIANCAQTVRVLGVGSCLSFSEPHLASTSIWRNSPEITA
jgi:hypothetical protein